ncbi:uncharacterized protein LOC142355662 isoform X2 [Convolutriloba macropyga]|uniref:uncharacterized protein LOC142355662 isoform X2 n=1 Tax=Convolutriloba macropyga TaxID=536237 RepID=UPI003F5223DA
MAPSGIEARQLPNEDGLLTFDASTAVNRRHSSRSASSERGNVKTKKLYRLKVAADSSNNEMALKLASDAKARSLTSLANLTKDLNSLQHETPDLADKSSLDEVPKLSFGSSAKRSLSQSELLHKRIRALADSDDHNPSRSRRRPIRIRRVGSNLSNYSRKSTEDEANSFLMDSIVPSKGRTDVVASLPVSHPGQPSNRHQTTVASLRLFKHKDTLDSFLKDTDQLLTSAVSGEGDSCDIIGDSSQRNESSLSSKSDWYKQMFKSMNPENNRGQIDADWAEDILDSNRKLLNSQQDNNSDPFDFSAYKRRDTHNFGQIQSNNSTKDSIEDPFDFSASKNSKRSTDTGKNQHSSGHSQPNNSTKKDLLTLSGTDNSKPSPAASSVKSSASGYEGSYNTLPLNSVSRSGSTITNQNSDRGLGDRMYFGEDNSPNLRTANRGHASAANPIEFNRQPSSQQSKSRVHNDHVMYRDPTNLSMHAQTAAPAHQRPHSQNFLDQQTLLKMSSDFTDSPNRESLSPGAASSAAARYRREKPRRADEFRQIRNYFDNLSQMNDNNSKFQGEHRRTQSLDRAKTSNKAKFLNEARKKFDDYPDSSADMPSSGGLGRNSMRGSNSKWKLSSVDENFLARRQYRYTVREPRDIKPLRPELPPAAAIDTDFIVRNSRFKNTNNGDFQNGAVQTPEERIVKNKSASSTDLLLDETFKAIFDPNHDDVSRSQEDMIDSGAKRQPPASVSTYKLSLKPKSREGSFERKGILSNGSRASKFIDSDSDDSVSMQSQIENYRRKPNVVSSKAPSNVVNDANMRANLEETLQKCNGKINGNHKGLFGSTGSLKSEPKKLVQSNDDLINLDSNTNSSPETNKPYGLNQPSLKSKDPALLVKSGIDLWETRIETVEVEKDQREREEAAIKKQLSPYDETPPKTFDHVNRPSSQNYGLNEHSSELVSPPGSNKSSFKESEADANEYNFTSAKFAAVNSIPQPYSRQKIGGVPFEPSSKFKSSSTTAVAPFPFPEQENQDIKHGSNASLVHYDEKIRPESQTSETSRVFSMPVKIYDDYSEDHMATVQNEVTEKFIYFPNTKKLLKVGPEDETESYLKQVNLLHKDCGYFITVKKQVTEDRLTKIEAISDRKEDRAKIKDDIRDVAKSLHDRAASNERKGRHEEEKPSDEKFSSKMDLAWNKAAETHPRDARENYGPGQPFDNSSNNLKDRSPDTRHQATVYPQRETEFGPDPILSPVDDAKSFPNFNSKPESYGQRDERFPGENSIYSRRFKKNDGTTSYRNIGFVQPMPGNRSISVDALNFGTDSNSGRVPLNQSSQLLTGDNNPNRSRMSLMSHGSDFMDSRLQRDGMQQQPVFQSMSPPNVPENSGSMSGANSGRFDNGPNDLMSPTNDFVDRGRNPKEGDSGVDIDYYSPNSEEVKYPMQVMQPSQDGLLTTNDRNPLVASDRGQSVSPSAMIGKEQQSPLDVGVAVNSDSNDGQKSGDSGKPSGKDGQKQKKNNQWSQIPELDDVLKIFRKRSKSRDDALSKSNTSEQSPTLSNASTKNAPYQNIQQQHPIENQKGELPNVATSSGMNFKTTYSHQVGAPITTGKSSEPQRSLSPVVTAAPTPIYANAIYNFKAQSDNEVGLTKNQPVIIKREIDANWFEVEANGRVGIVPKSYLKIVDQRSEQPGPKSTSGSNPGTMTKSKTNPNLSSELSSSGDRSRRDAYDKRSREPQNQQQGRGVSAGNNNTNTNKMKPLSVEVSSANQIPQMSQPSDIQRASRSSFTPKQSSEIVEGDQVIVKHSFRKESPTELDLRKRDIVIVTQRVDDNWLEGVIGNRRGIFPVTYVEKLLPENRGEDSNDRLKGGPMSPRSEISGSKSQLCLNQHQVNSTSNRSLNSVGLSKSAAGEEGSNNKMISDLFPTVGNKSGFEKEKDSTIERTPNSIVDSKSDWNSHLYSNLNKKWPETQGQKVPPGLNSSQISNTMPTSANTTSSNPMIDSDTQQEFNNATPEEPYRVKFNYEPSSHDELRLEEGDIVFVTEKCDDGWFIGYPEKNKQLCGAFPGNYVVKLA